MVFFHERRCLWNNPNHVGTEHLTSALTALLANSKILVPKQTNEKISLLDVIGTNRKIKQSQQGKRTYGKG